MVSKSIANAQTRVEGYNFDIRKHVLEYDDVVNKQREIIYAQRRQILTRATMRPTVQAMVDEELGELVKTFTTGSDPREWDLDALHAAVLGILPLSADVTGDRWQGMTPDLMHDDLAELAEQLYDAKEAEVGPAMMRELERRIMLMVVDHRWQRHLTDLDQLREGIGLRALAQVEPLVAYKKEAFEMYQELMGAIQKDIAHYIYHARIQTEAARPAQTVQTNRQESSDARPVRRAGATLGRNDPCHCGSGKKYKHCHMREDQKTGGPQPAAASANQPAARRR
jgi:preprotein translocase subunit SecA